MLCKKIIALLRSIQNTQMYIVWAERRDLLMLNLVVHTETTGLQRVKQGKFVPL